MLSVSNFLEDASLNPQPPTLPCRALISVQKYQIERGQSLVVVVVLCPLYQVTIGKPILYISSKCTIQIPAIMFCYLN